MFSVLMSRQLIMVPNVQSIIITRNSKTIIPAQRHDQVNPNATASAPSSAQHNTEQTKYPENAHVESLVAVVAQTHQSLPALHTPFAQ